MPNDKRTTKGGNNGTPAGVPPRDPPGNDPPGGDPSGNDPSDEESVGSDEALAASISEIRNEMQKIRTEFAAISDIKDGFAALQATLNSLLDKSNARDAEIAVLTINTDEQHQTFRKDVENKFLSLDVDLTTIKKRVSQLPLSGDLKQMFAEKTVNETMGIGTIVSDDSMDMTFQNRT
ncbi:MAG: hypothetical protein GY738_08350, partial [Pseudoalteromonas sp.]|nr:hypothetical protein [Pseudoalteromonas sp.]